MATVPTEPLIVVRPKSTSQTLEFYWRPPVSDGGSAITGYILTDGTNTYNITGSPGYYKLTGLTNGQTYSFTLAAVNGVGTGPAASFRSVEPGNKPQPPTSVSFTNQGSGNVLVNWTNPADIGGTSRLLGMLVRSFRVDINCNLNLSSFSTVNSIWGGNAATSYSYPFTNLPLTNNWQFQVQLQNDPGRTVRTLGFTSTFLASFPDFSPSSLTSLELWVDGREIFGAGVTNPAGGSTIGHWVDKSGRNRSTINFTGTSVYSNATSSIYLNGTSGFATSVSASSTIQSAFIIANVTNVNAAGTNTLLAGVTDGARQFRVESGGLRTLIQQSGGGLGPAGTLLNNSTFLAAYTNNGTTLTHYITGSTIQSGNSPAFGTGVSTTIGIRGGGNEGTTGTISEVLIYSSNVALLQRQTVEGYLAWKWGISTLLPIWHPFYNRKPLSTDSNLDFSPSSLGGTQVWLDAADATTVVRSGSTSTIITWNDKSGLANNATAVNNPTYIPTEPGVFFNGVNQHFTLPNGAVPFGNSSYSYYFVAQFSTINSSSGLFGAGSAANNSSYNLRPNDGNNGQIRNYWYFNDIATGNAFTANTRAAITSYYSTGSIRYLSLNYQSTVSDTPTARTQTNNNNTLGRTVANEFMFGRINEMLVYSTQHTQLERQRIEGYLAWKWGNQSFLPPSHLYAFRAPTRLDTFTAFSPSTINGLQLWTDASLFDVADNTSITMFSTLGTSYRGFQGAATVRSNALAGKSVVQILATQAMSTTGASAISASNFAIFYVGRQFGGSSNNGRVLQGDTNELYGYQAGFKPRWFSTGPGWIVQGNTAANSNWDIWTFGRTSANLATFNWNGSNQYNATNTPAINGLGFNKGAYPGEASDSQIAEIMVYSTSLTPGDYARVEGYLAWKWGLQASLPTNHPFYLASTINLGPITSTIT